MPTEAQLLMAEARGVLTVEEQDGINRLRDMGGFPMALGLPLAGDVSRAAGSAAEPSYDTALSPHEEASFQRWKAQYAPQDSGADYDLRGAYQAGLRPDPRTGHWPDTFKKPNHPTFSNESKYANAAPERAGRWDGETYLPAQQTTGSTTTAATTTPFGAGEQGRSLATATVPGHQLLGPGSDIPRMLGAVALPTALMAAKALPGGRVAGTLASLLAAGLGGMGGETIGPAFGTAPLHADAETAKRIGGAGLQSVEGQAIGSGLGALPQAAGYAAQPAQAALRFMGKASPTSTALWGMLFGGPAGALGLSAARGGAKLASGPMAQRGAAALRSGISAPAGVAEAEAYLESLLGQSLSSRRTAAPRP